MPASNLMPDCLLPGMIKRKAEGSECRCGATDMGDGFHYSPLECPLPKAPSLRMFCMYGVGIPTERAYHYQHLRSAKVNATQM